MQWLPGVAFLSAPLSAYGQASRGGWVVVTEDSTTRISANTQRVYMDSPGVLDVWFRTDLSQLNATGKGAWHSPSPDSRAEAMAECAGTIAPKQ